MATLTPSMNIFRKEGVARVLVRWRRPSLLEITTLVTRAAPWRWASQELVQGHGARVGVSSGRDIRTQRSRG